MVAPVRPVSGSRGMAPMISQSFPLTGTPSTYMNVISAPENPMVEIEKLRCKECGDTFAMKSLYDIHMESHARETFNCDKCFKKFTRRVHYETHMQSHEGLKSHHCPYCHRAFSMKGNLRRHIRIHTNEAPYECPICFQRFRRSDGLKGHIKRHEACGEGVPSDMIPSQATTS